jgi:hypothetical protein
MISPIQNNLASLIKRIPSGLPSPNGPKKIGSGIKGGIGISMLPARLKTPRIVGGKILKPRIRIRIMQNALKNQLGQK